MKPSTDNHAILYVRVAPADKERLRVLAAREFNGSMARAIRHLLAQYVAGHRPRIFSE